MPPHAALDPKTPLLDVLIVGYGPVGQLLALKLAQAGLAVGVVERWSALFHAPRAVHYDHEIARIFQGAGVGEALSQITDEAADAELVSGKGDVLMSMRWDGPAESGWPRANGFAQPELEAILHEAIGRQPTVRLWRGHIAEGLRQLPERVELTVRQVPDDGAGAADAEPFVLKARYLVGCDGANSFVREQAGLTMTDLGFHYDWLVVNIRWKPGHEGRVAGLRQTLYPARPTTIVPAGRNRRRWEFMLLPGDDREDMGRESTAWQMLAEHGVSPDQAVLERHAVYTFQARWADHWRAGRVLIAGDAAHLMPPFMAQGMCSGIRDAASLAWRLPLVIQHMAPPSLLDTYTTERLPHVQHLIHGSVNNGKFFCMTHPVGWRVRDAVMRLANRFPKLGPQAPAPGPIGPGLLLDGDAQAGKLSFQGHVRFKGRSGRFDDVVGGGFVLAGFEFDPTAHLSDANRRWFGELGGVVAHIGAGAPVQDVAGGYAEAFARRGVVAWLNRPDFYQFGTAQKPGDVDALVTALRHKLAA